LGLGPLIFLIFYREGVMSPPCCVIGTGSSSPHFLSLYYPSPRFDPNEAAIEGGLQSNKRDQTAQLLPFQQVTTSETDF